MQSTTTAPTQNATGSFQSNSSQKNGKNMHSTSRYPKGKSKYAKKSRSKSKKPVAAKPTRAYTSVCCQAPAVKPACTRVDKKKALEQGLGTWKCSGCGKKCSVTVGKAKEPLETKVPLDTTVITDGPYVITKSEVEVPLGG
jgi:hypothetical protein